MAGEAGGTMSAGTARPPVAISDSSRRTLVRLAGASTLIISNLVMLITGIVIGNVARKRIDKRTRGIA
jgi:hypothetical protein